MSFTVCTMSIYIDKLFRLSITSHTIIMRDIVSKSGIMTQIIPMWDIIALKIKKSGDITRFPRILSNLSRSVSRVLSCTVIYLDLPSPTSSSDIHGVPPDGQPYWRTPNLATGGVYMAYRVTTVSVSSYLAFPSLPQRGDSQTEILKAKKQSSLRRFISVALSLKSPSPDVIRHPRPMLLGLSSWCKSIPRPYNKLKSHLYYNTFLEKNHLFCCFFLKKSVK